MDCLFKNVSLLKQDKESISKAVVTVVTPIGVISVKCKCELNFKLVHDLSSLFRGNNQFVTDEKKYYSVIHIILIIHKLSSHWSDFIPQGWIRYVMNLPYLSAKTVNQVSATPYLVTGKI